MSKPSKVRMMETARRHVKEAMRKPSEDLSKLLKGELGQYAIPSLERPHVIVEVVNGPYKGLRVIKVLHCDRATPFCKSFEKNKKAFPWISINMLHICNFQSKLNGPYKEVQEEFWRCLRVVLEEKGLLMSRQKFSRFTQGNKPTSGVGKLLREIDEQPIIGRQFRLRG